MKKIAKMSLVAAMAISGLTSASAVDLTEAIKGVNISGKVEYRAEKVTKFDVDVSGDKEKFKSEMQHDIDLELKVVIPVNDMVKATLRIVEVSDEDKDDGQLNSTAKTLKADRIFFTYTKDSFVSNFGLIDTPLTDGVEADGINASYDFGVAQVKAGYLYTTGMGSDEVAFIGVNGSIDPVSYYATYATILDSKTNKNINGSTGDQDANALHLGVSANVGIVSLALDYSQKTGLDATGATGTDENQKQYKLSVGADFGMVSASLDYAKNGKNGGSTLLDNSDAAASEISIGAIELHGLGNAYAYLLTVQGDINAQNSLKARYAVAKVKNTDGKIKVLRLNYNYAMSKNFNLYSEYTMNKVSASNITLKSNDYVLGAKYTF